MQTRRDQLQAYRYQVRRVLTALLGSDPESPEQPMRRAATATLAGVMVAVLALVGAGFYGELHGGSASKWQQAGVLVVERGTGSRFVWADDQLHPVLNYTSARLLLNAPAAPVVQVSRRSLEEAPRGRTVGIAGAPDSLPDASHLVVGPWSVCAQGDPGRVPAGDRAERSVSALMMGVRSVGVVPRSGNGPCSCGPGPSSSWSGTDGGRHGCRLTPQHRARFPTGVGRVAGVARRRARRSTAPRRGHRRRRLCRAHGRRGADERRRPPPRHGCSRPRVVLCRSSRWRRADQRSAGSAAQRHGRPPPDRRPAGEHRRRERCPAVPDTTGTRRTAGGPPGAGRRSGWAAGVCGERRRHGDRCRSAGPRDGGDPLPDPRSSTSTATTTSSASSDRTGVDDVIVGPGTAAVVTRLAADGSPTAEYLVADDGSRYALPSQAAVTALGLAGAHVVGLRRRSLICCRPGRPSTPASALEFAGP